MPHPITSKEDSTSGLVKPVLVTAHRFNPGSDVQLVLINDGRPEGVPYSKDDIARVGTPTISIEAATALRDTIATAWEMELDVNKVIQEHDRIIDRIRQMRGTNSLCFQPSAWPTRRTVHLRTLIWA